MIALCTSFIRRQTFGCPHAQEFCNLAKLLQPNQRQQLFVKLISLGMFAVLTRILQHCDTEAKLRATDILMAVIGHDPAPLRSFLLQQSGNALLGAMVRELVHGGDTGMPEQVNERSKNHMFVIFD